MNTHKISFTGSLILAGIMGCLGLALLSGEILAGKLLAAFAVGLGFLFFKSHNNFSSNE